MEKNQNSIITNFYFGDIHENFKSNKGNIGSCKNKEYPYCSCSFKEIIITFLFYYKNYLKK